MKGDIRIWRYLRFISSGVRWQLLFAAVTVTLIILILKGSSQEFVNTALAVFTLIVCVLEFGKPPDKH